MAAFLRPHAAAAAAPLGMMAVAVLLLLCGSLAPAQALTYNQELVAAQAAMLRTPGYTLFAHNLRNISALTVQYSRAQRNPPVTALAPNDAAVTKALSALTPTRAAVTNLVALHVIRAPIAPARMVMLRFGQPLATFLPGKNIIKASPAGSRVVKLKSARTPVPATITKAIYVGRFIVIYGVDKVLMA